MEKKKILIVSRSFYPQNSPRSFRTTELAKELSRQGHNVTVIVPRNPLHDDFAKQHGITIKDSGNSDEPKTDKTRVGFVQKVMNRFREQYLLHPIFKIKDYVFDSLKAEEGKNYDMLISIAAPHPVHWGVSKALKKYKNIAKVWVADCGDPFMLTHNLQYKRPFYFKYYEKDFCRNADFITIPTADAKDGYYPEFRDKLVVIPQGFNFEDVRISDKENTSGIIEFGYAGSLIKARRDPSELLKYLKKSGIDFRFYIYSKNQSFAESLAEKYPGQVIYKGEADRLTLLYHLSELNFVLNFENVGTNQSPSKLIDYAIIKKPILSVMYDELDTEAADGFVKGDYSRQLTVQNVERYQIQNVARNFIELTSK